MDPIEYRTIDKTEWARGPWDAEPDKVQWYDEATGFPCLIVRTPHHGALCGYVGVRPGHPWHGKDYDDVGMLPGEKPEGYVEEWYVDAHGGLTFAGPCREGAEETGVCHVPAPGDTDNIWWLGFDCAHSGDQTPAIDATLRKIGHDFSYREKAEAAGYRDSYKDIEYVRGQVANLAQQAKKVEAHDQ
jgi:hypothetical protein